MKLTKNVVINSKLKQIHFVTDYLKVTKIPLTQDSYVEQIAKDAMVALI